MKSFLIISAIAIAAPALAQTDATPATTPQASTNAAQTDAAPQPMTDAPAAAAPATNSDDAVAAAVSKDWATYDADKNDSLSKEEFTAWMTALRQQSPAQQADTADIGSWADAAFAQADSDKNSQVTRPELEGFLRG